MATITDTCFGICPKCKKEDFFRYTVGSKYRMFCDNCGEINLREENLEFIIIR